MADKGPFRVLPFCCADLVPTVQNLNIDMVYLHFVELSKKRMNFNDIEIQPTLRNRLPNKTQYFHMIYLGKSH